MDAEEFVQLTALENLIAEAHWMRNNIHEFVRQNDVEGIRRLLAEGTDVEERSRYGGSTPLMAAISKGSDGLECVKLLLEHGADVRGVDEDDGCDVLQTAIGTDEPAVVRLLLESGLNLAYTTKTPYDFFASSIQRRDAWHCKHLGEIVRLLNRHGANIPELDAQEEASAEALSGGFGALRLFLKVGANLSPLQWTPLHLAVAVGTVEGIQQLLDEGADLTARDSWERTPWLLSLVVGDVEKADLLLRLGADRNDVGHIHQPPVIYAVETRNVEMLRWLIKEGFDINAQSDVGWTALTCAVMDDSVACADVLLGAGADRYPPVRVDWKRQVNETLFDSISLGPLSDLPRSEEVLGAFKDRLEERVEEREPLIESAGSLEMVHLLLRHGEVLEDISNEMRAALLGLDSDGEIHCTEGEYRHGKHRRFGISNPERMNDPFWEAMVRGGRNAYQARAKFNGCEYDDEPPVWCSDRFGKSITPLTDGRYIEIAGEHEDGCDPDFCIYNDVFVHYGGGRFEIYGYPEDVFPTTDFHSASLVGDHIYIIGNVGYPQQRVPGFTPVYRLHTETLRIEKVETSGANPGWIGRHKATLLPGPEIRVSGGKVIVSKEQDGYVKNEGVFVLDLRTMVWRREA